jgi:adenosylhomocysteine nucleosidase
MLAIVSAMPEEIALVVESLSGVRTREFGQRQFHVGAFEGTEAVAVFSRMGKVAAAATVTQLLAAFPVDTLVFSGVAGGVHQELAIGDVVVATGLLQHDLDARPIFPRYEVPLLGRSVFDTDAAISDRLARAATPKVRRGVVASGDKFFARHDEVQELRGRLPEVACVEMEGAAVAQVCAEYSVPFGVVRTISDAADENSQHDFPRFARQIARHYSAGILRHFVRTA